MSIISRGTILFQINLQSFNRHSLQYKNNLFLSYYFVNRLYKRLSEKKVQIVENVHSSYRKYYD